MNTFVQIPLSLPYRKALGREDFLIAPCNLEAVSWIDKYPNWPMHALLIYGEGGSGKTHLASIFSDFHLKASLLTDDFLLPMGVLKVVVEDVDSLQSETALFHLYNQVQELGGALLMTSRVMPVFKLADLQSRLNAIPKAVISMPDDELIYAVLMKAFYERHVSIEMAVLEYAARHMERSFTSIQAVIEKADTLALSAGRKITIPLMKQAIEQVKNKV